MKAFSAIYTAWKKGKQATLKPASYSTYVLLAEKYLLPKLKDKETITEADMEAIREEVVKAGGSQKTAKDVSVLLMGILRYGAKEGLCPMPNWQTKAKETTGPQPITILNLKQEKQLLKQLAEEPNYRNIGIYLALTAGLKQGEICALTWQDIDLEHGYIHIRGSQGYIYAVNGDVREWRWKTEAESSAQPREIPLADEQIAFLKPIIQGHRPELLVLSNSETPMHPRTLRQYLTTLLKKQNLPPVTFRDLRHTFAVRCLEAGVDFVTLAQLLGNDSVAATVSTYQNFVQPQPRKSLQAMLKRLG